MSASLAILTLCAGIICRYEAVKVNNNNYETLISQSAATSLENKISSYKKAIAIYPDRIDGYMKMIEAYEDDGKFGKTESEIMVGISKEFINTFVETGRKLPLGGREKSNIALEKRVKEARPNNYPKKIGVDADGKDIYETVNDGMIPSHNTLKVHAGCPDWLK